MNCENCIHYEVCKDWCEVMCKMFDAENLWHNHPCTNRFQAKTEWISVHDRLPAMGENVMCFENGKFYIAFFEKFEEGAWWDWVAFDRDDTWNEVCPSYWMPLPSAPDMKGGAE